MRLVTYRGTGGTARTGAIVVRDGTEVVVDLHEASGGRIPAGDLLALLESGDRAIDVARDVAATATGGTPLAKVTLLAPMARPPKILAAAGNYQAHIEEGGGKRVDKTRISPKLFSKPSSSIIGPGEAVPMSTVSKTLDWELELGVIVGRGGRNIPVERALEHVAGYTVINDLSARTADWGIEGRTPSDWDLYFDWLNGKWGDGFCPMGPWVVTADEIADPQALKVRLEVNGTVRQDASTAEMIFTCAELIAFASRFTTLEPGDVFATGTPSGTGDAIGVYLATGDVMAGWVEGIGTLVTTVGPARA